MKNFLILTIFLTILASCSQKSEKENTDAAKPDSVSQQVTTQPLDTGVPTPEPKKRILPDFAQNTLKLLPDSFSVHSNEHIYGDFNADGKADVAIPIVNSNSSETGIVIVHYMEGPDYEVFGAGKKIDSLGSFEEIEAVDLIEKGEIIAPSQIDPATGEIVGPEENRFRLVGDALLIVDRATGEERILYWNGRNYTWSLLE